MLDACITKLWWKPEASPVTGKEGNALHCSFGVIIEACSAPPPSYFTPKSEAIVVVKDREGTGQKYLSHHHRIKCTQHSCFCSHCCDTEAPYRENLGERGLFWFHTFGSPWRESKEVGAAGLWWGGFLQDSHNWKQQKHAGSRSGHSLQGSSLVTQPVPKVLQSPEPLPSSRNLNTEAWGRHFIAAHERMPYRHCLRLLLLSVQNNMKAIVVFLRSFSK